MAKRHSSAPPSSFQSWDPERTVILDLNPANIPVSKRERIKNNIWKRYDFRMRTPGLVQPFLDDSTINSQAAINSDRAIKRRRLDSQTAEASLSRPEANESNFLGTKWDRRSSLRSQSPQYTTRIMQLTRTRKTTYNRIHNCYFFTNGSSSSV
jgi:hypothetical protein